MTLARAGLIGKKVLVVESEFLLPIELYKEIALAGADVIGPVSFVDDVLLLVADNPPDTAVIDGRLEPGDRDAVFRILGCAGVPILTEIFNGHVAGRAFPPPLMGRTLAARAVALSG